MCNSLEAWEIHHTWHSLAFDRKALRQHTCATHWKHDDFTILGTASPLIAIFGDSCMTLCKHSWDCQLVWKAVDHGDGDPLEWPLGMKLMPQHCSTAGMGSYSSLRLAAR